MGRCHKVPRTGTDWQASLASGSSRGAGGEGTTTSAGAGGEGSGAGPSPSPPVSGGPTVAYGCITSFSASIVTGLLRPV